MDFLEYFSKINKGFKNNHKGDVEYLTIPSFDEAGGIVHCFTTRKSGVSKGGFSSLNFSFGREKNQKNIIQNFKIISDTLGVPYKDIVLDNYGHTPNVLLAEEKMRGKGVYNNSDLPTCDGLATITKNLPLVTLHADCAPIFFYDKIKKAGCVCHAGWRGVVGGIVKNALDIMTKELNCNIDDILIGVGPCIRKCCFEIKSDLEKIFKEEFGDFSVEYKDDKIYGDIEKGIVQSFYKYGIPAKNVTCAFECTYCNEVKYFSFRRQGKDGGAMASVLMII
jgi:polyphenol oxidase